MTISDLLSDLLPELDCEYIFITGNYSFLVNLKLGKRLDSLGHFHDAVMRKYPESTIVFPLASMNLCNTSTPFSLLDTPSFKMGAYAEFIRSERGCERTMHPFWSCGAVGQNAKGITEDISPHAYAMGSIWDRLCSKNATQITIGKSVNYALTSIHHCETISGVPYRYTKEYLHTVIDSDGDCFRKLFYLSVFYPSLNIEKKTERNSVFLNGLPSSAFKIYENSRGPHAPSISTLKLNKFREHACNMLSSDIYSYLEHPPQEELRMYRR